MLEKGNTPTVGQLLYKSPSNVHRLLCVPNNISYNAAQQILSCYCVDHSAAYLSLHYNTEVNVKVS